MRAFEARSLRTVVALIAPAFLAGCQKREVPQFAAAAKACGVSYAAVEDAFVRSGASMGRGGRKIRLGRCEVDRNGIGQVSAHFVKVN